MDKLISIIVPVYNVEKYLSDCIESILSQTYSNIQAILINDGSTDNSLSICNYYKKTDSRILVIDKPNEGVSATRNLGLELAEGEYIGFVDGDDYIAKDMYEKLLKQIENDKSQICAMTPYTINGLGNYRYNNDNIISGTEALKQLLLLKFPTSLWAFLYSKQVIKKFFLNEEIHFFEDFEFNFRVLSSVKKVSICNEKLYNYRINENSANMQKINNKRITCLSVYEPIKKELEKNNINLFKYSNYFNAHFIISIIASISKSGEVDDKYYRMVIGKTKATFLEMILSRFVPLKYKLTILMFLISPYFFSKLLYFLKYK